MSETTLRVGIVGAGANTRKHHIPGLRRQPGVEIVAVANRSRESAERAAAELDIPRAMSDWRALVSDDAIDAVCIGTWPYMHAPVTIAALEAGKHVLCEARMALDSDEAKGMLQASRAQPHLVAQIVPAPHTLALDRTIVDMIGAGHIGELIAVDAHIPAAASYPQPESAIHWRHERDLSGNNVMNMGIWYEAFMRWVGPAATVHAVGQSVVNHRRGSDGRRVAMTIPDHIEVLCKMEQGGQMRMMVSTVLGHAAGLEVRVHGTEGTLRVAEGDIGDSGLGLWAARRGDAALEPVAVASENIGGWRVEEEFVNAVRRVEPVTHTDLVTGVKYMEWTDAVTRSLRSGRTIGLPLAAS